MKLFLDAEIVPPVTPVTRADLLAALRDTVKEELIELGVLDDIAHRLTRGESCKERRICKGTPAVPGHNGRLVLTVKPFNGRGSPRESSRGHVDFKSLHLFDNVKKGSVIGKIFPPTIGANGIDALGKPLVAASGKPEKISVDKTIRLGRPVGEELECLVAELDGYLFNDAGRLTVRNELKFPGDVDLSTGNLDFIGLLSIGGDISPGFSVRAKLGLTVSGGARGAVIESSDGEISIKGFVFGGPGARVTGGKSVSLRSAQELTVDARGDILVSTNTIDSLLRTHRALLAPQASIVGGDVFAVCGGEIGELGNAAGKLTTFHLCNDVEANPEFAEILAKVANHERGIELISNHLGPYAKTPARIALLKEPFKGKMNELYRKLSALQSSHKTLVQRRDRELAAASSNEIQRVNVLGTLNAGCKIICGAEALDVKDAVAGPVSIDFDPVTKQFSIGALKPLLCNLVDKSKQTEKIG